MQFFVQKARKIFLLFSNRFKLSDFEKLHEINKRKKKIAKGVDPMKSVIY